MQDPQLIQELKNEAASIIEEERATGWQNIFLVLAFARHFSFYLILITFWIHIF